MMSRFLRKITGTTKRFIEQDDSDMSSAGVDRMEFTEDGIKIVVNKSEDTITIGDASMSIGSFQDVNNQVENFVED